MRKRRLARSMLVGAPILLAQLATHSVQEVFANGEESIQGFDMATKGTAKQFMPMLSKASPLAVLRLIINGSEANIKRGLSQVAECLNHTQHVVNSVGDKPRLNPVMNAVSVAFKRRRLVGSFGKC